MTCALNPANRHTTSTGGSMWHDEHTVETDLAPEAIWGALWALETGEVPMGNGDQREATGLEWRGSFVGARVIDVK